MNICGEIRSRLYRLLTPIRPVTADDGAKPPVQARITYYPGGLSKPRSQRQKRSAGGRDK
jgi:hypothetical protein